MMLVGVVMQVVMVMMVCRARLWLLGHQVKLVMVMVVMVALQVIVDIVVLVLLLHLLLLELNCSLKIRMSLLSVLSEVHKIISVRYCGLMLG